MFNQNINQNIFKRESSKINNFFLHTKQESSKTTFANEGSIKIETRVVTPKSSRSRISSKSFSSLTLYGSGLIYNKHWEDLQKGQVIGRFPDKLASKSRIDFEKWPNWNQLPEKDTLKDIEAVVVAYIMLYGILYV